MPWDVWLSLQHRLRSRVFGRIALRAPRPPRYETLKNDALGRVYARILSNVVRSSRAGAFASAQPFDLWIDIGTLRGEAIAAVSETLRIGSLISDRTLVFGFEADAYRRDLTLARRVDYARAIERTLNDSRLSYTYIPERLGDALEAQLTKALSTQTDPARPDPNGVRILVTAFFPFVSKDPARAWGLPGSFADFESLINHELLRGIRKADQKFQTRSKVFFFGLHQGEWERDYALPVYHTYRACHDREGSEPTVHHWDQTTLNAWGWPGKHELFSVHLWLARPQHEAEHDRRPTI